MWSSFKAFITSFFYSEEIIPIEKKEIVQGKDSLLVGYETVWKSVWKTSTKTKYRTETYTTLGAMKQPIYHTRYIPYSVSETNLTSEPNSEPRFKEIDVQNVQVTSGEAKYTIGIRTNDNDKLRALLDELDKSLLVKTLISYHYMTRNNGDNLPVWIHKPLPVSNFFYDFLKFFGGVSTVLLVVIASVHSYYGVKKLLGVD